MLGLGLQDALLQIVRRPQHGGVEHAFIGLGVDHDHHVLRARHVFIHHLVGLAQGIVLADELADIGVDFHPGRAKGADAENAGEDQQNEAGPAGDNGGHRPQYLLVPVDHGVGEEADAQQVAAHGQPHAGEQDRGIGHDEGDFAVSAQPVPDAREPVERGALFRPRKTRMPDIEQDGQQNDREKESQRNAGGGHEAEHPHRQQLRGRQRQHPHRCRQRGDEQRKPRAAVGPGQGAVVRLALPAVGKIGVHHVDAIGDAHREHQQHRQRDEGRYGDAKPHGDAPGPGDAEGDGQHRPDHRAERAEQNPQQGDENQHHQHAEQRQLIDHQQHEAHGWRRAHRVVLELAVVLVPERGGGHVEGGVGERVDGLEFNLGDLGAFVEFQLHQAIGRKVETGVEGNAGGVHRRDEIRHRLHAEIGLNQNHAVFGIGRIHHANEVVLGQRPGLDRGEFGIGLRQLRGHEAQRKQGVALIALEADIGDRLHPPNAVQLVEIHGSAEDLGRIIRRVEILPVAQVVGEFPHRGQRIAGKHVAVPGPVDEQHGIVAAELAAVFVQSLDGGVGIVEEGLVAEVDLGAGESPVQHQRGDHRHPAEHKAPRAQHPIRHPLEELAQAQQQFVHQRSTVNRPARHQHLYPTPPPNSSPCSGKCQSKEEISPSRSPICRSMSRFTRAVSLSK